MTKPLFLAMIGALPLAAGTRPLDDQCACERAQSDCGRASEDMVVGLPDYPGC